MKPRVILAGGSGFIGQHLSKTLEAAGFDVDVLSRRKTGSVSHGNLCTWDELSQRIEGARAIVNLSGEGIAGGRWTPDRKRSLRESRVQPAMRIAQAIREAMHPPGVLIQMSAIGFYGNTGDICTEASPTGSGFLAELCQAWESAALESEASCRLVILRLGVVLAQNGGAFPRMLKPVRCGVGSPLGVGTQLLSWIHIQDLMSMILHAVNDPTWSGVINAVAPEPISNRAFMQYLASELHRPLWPMGTLTGWILNLFLGEMAQSMLLQGVDVRPNRALALGYRFDYPNATQAISDLLKPIEPR